MSSEAVNQAEVFARCIFLGFLSGAVFDFFKVIRKTHRGAFIVNFCDACFWVFYGIIFSAFVYRVNDAALRWYVFLAVITGATVYFAVLSKLFVAVGTVLANALEAFLKLILRILAAPILFAARKTGRAAVIISVPLRNFNKKIRAIRRKFIFRKKLMKKI